MKKQVQKKEKEKIKKNRETNNSAIKLLSGKNAILKGKIQKEKKIEEKTLKYLLNKHIFKAKDPITVQDTIAYKEIYEDGICELEGGLYNKSLEFGDINYQLSTNEDKELTFKRYCDMLNSFNPETSFQLTFVNQKTDVTNQLSQIDILEKEDNYNDIRLEYSDMLNNQLRKDQLLNKNDI